MMKELKDKLAFGSVSQEELPEDLNRFSCELVSEEYLLQDDQKVSYMFLKFTPRSGSQSAFMVELNSLKEPNNLMHVYHMTEDKFNIQGQIMLKCNCTFRKSVKREEPKVVTIDEEEDDDEEYERVIDFAERKLDLDQEADDYDCDDSDSSSMAVTPDLAYENRVKKALIDLLSMDERRGSVKEICSILRNKYSLKVPQKTVKSLLDKLCNKVERKFILKDEEASGRKKIKLN